MSIMNHQNQEGYYQAVVSKPTTDISEPLHRLKGKKSLGLASECVWMGLQLMIVMYFGLRPDYVQIPGYLRHHFLYYFFWISVRIGVEIVLNHWLDWKRILGTDWLPGTLLMLGTTSFYYVGITLWVTVAKPILTKKIGKARFIMISEFLISIMWFGVGMGVRAFCLSVKVMPFVSQDIVPSWVTTSIGIVLVVTGYVFKGWACTLTGFNSYFLRDMLTDIPNSHFVHSSLYSVFRHPMYTVGYIQALGLAIYYRSLEGCIAYAYIQLCILLFVHLIEEPFIERTYMVKEGTGPEVEKPKSE